MGVPTSRGLSIAIIIIVVLAATTGYFAYQTVKPATTTAVSNVNVLNVATWTGPFTDGLEAQLPGFNKANNVITNVIGQGGVGETLAKLQASLGHQSIDVWYTNNEAALRAANSGLLEAIDTSQVQSLSSYASTAPFMVNGTVYGIRNQITYIGIIIRTDMVDASGIKSYKDLWNTIYAKKIAIPQLYWYTGGIVYCTARWWSGSFQNTQVGFDKLKQLVPNIVNVYSTDSEAVRLLVSRQAPIVIGPFDDAYAAAEEGAPIKVVIPTDSPLFQSPQMITFVKNSPASDQLKYQFLNYALQPSVNNAYSNVAGNYPLLKNPSVGPALMPYVGFTNTWEVDPSFTVSNYPSWSRTWQTEFVPLLSS
ncbi:MAG TPA: extracellular solute-binding protein [Candidatus Bathyarchaeia archaeon]|nr:extracellular solute-binding protein [Candidatus Bathyarchaeia archaeon]